MLDQVITRSAFIFVTVRNTCYILQLVNVVQSYTLITYKVVLQASHYKIINKSH